MSSVPRNIVNRRVTLCLTTVHVYGSMMLVRVLLILLVTRTLDYAYLYVIVLSVPIATRLVFLTNQIKVFGLKI